MSGIWGEMKVVRERRASPDTLYAITPPARVYRMAPLDSPCCVFPRGFFINCGQILVIEDSHAREPCGRVRLSKTASLIQSILHPEEKRSRISSCEIRRGP